MLHKREIDFFGWIKELFTNKNRLEKGDIGIYKDVLSLDTSNDVNNVINYIIHAKVKIIAIYEDLVEVETVEITITNVCNEHIKSLIEDNMPKYINPKFIKWELKPIENDTV